MGCGRARYFYIKVHMLEQNEVRFAEGPARNAACPCGSGKRYKYCCGDLRTPATPLSYTAEMLKRDLTAALAAQGERDWETATRHAFAVVDKVPHQRQALRTLRDCKTQVRDYAAAAVLMDKLLYHYPHDPEVNADAAELRELSGDVAAALEFARKAVRLDPNQSRAHRLLGRIAMRHGDVGAAEVHLRQTLYARGDDPGVAADLAGVLSNMGFKSEAEHYFKVSISLDPDQPGTLINWAGMEESRHDLARARRLLDQARELADAHPLLPLSEAALLFRDKRFKDALECLRAVDHRRLTVSDQSRYFFLRGQVRDRLRRFEDAFKDCARANRLSSEWLGLRYDAAVHLRRAESLKRFFTTDRMAALPKAVPLEDEGKPTPVFLLGFPRSGGTLALQALTMHQGIVGGDELFCVPNVRERVPAMLDGGAPYPDGLAALADHTDRVYRLRREYWSMLEQAGILDPGAAYYIDRLPLNEWDLGLIHLMLPEARFIHVIRHPMDAVLSLFSHDIRHGGLCGFDLESAARHFALTQDLLTHYRDQLSLDILTVRYEDIVTRHQATLQAMTQHIGADWSDDCLRFYDNPAYVRGPSYAELKEPLFNDRINRYKHYTAELKPVAPILKPWIEKLGYRLD